MYWAAVSLMSCGLNFNGNTRAERLQNVEKLEDVTHIGWVFYINLDQLRVFAFSFTCFFLDPHLNDVHHDAWCLIQTSALVLEVWLLQQCSASNSKMYYPSSQSSYPPPKWRSTPWYLLSPMSWCSRMYSMLDQLKSIPNSGHIWSTTQSDEREALATRFKGSPFNKQAPISLRIVLVNFPFLHPCMASASSQIIQDHVIDARHSISLTGELYTPAHLLAG